LLPFLPLPLPPFLHPLTMLSSLFPFLLLFLSMEEDTPTCFSPPTGKFFRFGCFLRPLSPSSLTSFVSFNFATTMDSLNSAAFPWPGYGPTIAFYACDLSPSTSGGSIQYGMVRCFPLLCFSVVIANPAHLSSSSPSFSPLPHTDGYHP
jgi:hypothetical protein